MLLRYCLLLLTAVAVAQSPKSVDFTTCWSSLELNPVKRNVTGTVKYEFTVKAVVDSIRIDAQKMEFTQVLLNGKPISFKNNQKQLILYQGFQLGPNSLQFQYEAFPTQALYFVNWDFSPTVQTPEQVQGQIWTQGQGKYTKGDFFYHGSFSQEFYRSIKWPINSAKTDWRRYQMAVPNDPAHEQLFGGFGDWSLPKTNAS